MMTNAAKPYNFARYIWTN